MTSDEAKQAVAIALAACPAHASKLNATAISAMASAWAMLLEDLTSAEVMSALKRHLSTSQWLPAPAELRKICAEAKHGTARPGGEAWGDVLKAVGRFGSYRVPVFDDPLVGRAVASLGWRELCLSENQAADRARFVELYDKLASKAAEEQAVGALPGVARPALRDGSAKSIGSLLLDAMGPGVEDRRH